MVREAVVESSAAVDQVVDHPGSRRATDYQLHIISQCGPTVPEVLQSCDEPGLRGVHPRQFVNEYHLLPFRQCFQIAGQFIECQNPVFLDIQSLRARTFLYGDSEGSELLCLCGPVYACDIERELVLRRHSDKECFPHAPSSVECHKLGSP